jgi:hypothetical protein
MNPHRGADGGQGEDARPHHLDADGSEECKMGLGSRPAGAFLKTGSGWLQV